MRRRGTGVHALTHLASLLLSVLLFVLSATSTVPLTPKGVHCPTAKVQTISEEVAALMPNGVKSSAMVERAPREGDKEFVQCLCAEKKASSAKSEAMKTEATGFVILAYSLPVPIRIAAQFCSLPSPGHLDKTGIWTAWGSAPPVPPPNVL